MGSSQYLSTYYYYDIHVAATQLLYVEAKRTRTRENHCLSVCTYDVRCTSSQVYILRVRKNYSESSQTKTPAADRYIQIHTLPSSNEVHTYLRKFATTNHNSGSAFAFFCLPLAGGQEKAFDQFLAILLDFFNSFRTHFLATYTFATQCTHVTYLSATHSACSVGITMALSQCAL